MNKFSAFQWRERGKAGYASVAMLNSMDYNLSRNNNHNDKSPTNLVIAYNKIIGYPDNTQIHLIPEFRMLDGYPIVFAFGILLKLNPSAYAKEKCRPVPSAFSVDATVGQIKKRWNLKPIMIGM